MTTDHKESHHASADAVYAEFYNEARRFRDYQLTFAQWCISIMLAFGGGYIGLTTHEYTPTICSRILLGLAILVLSGGAILVIVHADARFNEIKTFTKSLQPDFMKFEPEARRVRPHHVMIFLVVTFTIVVCMLIATYPR